MNPAKWAMTKVGWPDSSCILLLLCHRVRPLHSHSGPSHCSISDATSPTPLHHLLVLELGLGMGGGKHQAYRRQITEPMWRFSSCFFLYEMTSLTQINSSSVYTWRRKRSWLDSISWLAFQACINLFISLVHQEKTCFFRSFLTENNASLS